jgi:hypothetical protein
LVALETTAELDLYTSACGNALAYHNRVHKSRIRSGLASKVDIDAEPRALDRARCG